MTSSPPTPEETPPAANAGDAFPDLAGIAPEGPPHQNMERLRSLEQRIVAAIQRKRATRDPNRLYDQSLTFGQRVADKVAATMGSWPFIITQSILLFVWIILNASELIWHAWDPYPFILLNLMLSLQAAYAAPIIMMSQNRQSAKDRLEAELDLQTDLKAESLIEELHGHMDELRIRQWKELLDIQEEQITLLRDAIARMQGATAANGPPASPSGSASGTSTPGSSPGS